jgi:hypothetical protein
MLQPGDSIPHFDVTNLQGERVAYRTLWQRSNLVLVTVPAEDPDGTFTAYVAQLTARLSSLMRRDTECVATRDAVAGISCPGVTIADRWGEIFHLAGAAEATDLPLPDEVLEWVTYVQCQCPECQGEAR